MHGVDLYRAPFRRPPPQLVVWAWPTTTTIMRIQQRTMIHRMPARWQPTTNDLTRVHDPDHIPDRQTMMADLEPARSPGIVHRRPRAGMAAVGPLAPTIRRSLRETIRDRHLPRRITASKAAKGIIIE